MLHSLFAGIGIFLAGLFGAHQAPSQVASAVSSAVVVEQSYQQQLLQAAATSTAATSTISYQPVIESLIHQQSTSTGISASYLDARLGALDQSLRQFVSQTASAPFFSGPSAPLSVEAFAPSQRINNLSNITVSGVSGLTASDIPSLSYLPLSGGTLTGDVSLTNATSTTLFSTFGHFTTGLIDTLTSTAATITNLVATTITGTNATFTNATTTTLSVTGGAQIGQTIIPKGLDPTGVADNSTQIQAAINQLAASGGGTVYLPAPTNANGYIAHDLVMKNGVSLKGDMPATTYQAGVVPEGSMQPSGGTWINCNGHACAGGTGIRGGNITDIGFDNWSGNALAYGGDGIDGLAESAFDHVFFYGNSTVGVSDTAIYCNNCTSNNFNFIHGTWMNTILKEISQNNYDSPANSVVTDMELTVGYARSAANGNNTPQKAGIVLEVLQPTMGSAENLNYITFIRPQIQFPSGGDGTGVAIALIGLNSSAHVYGSSFYDADIEGNYGDAFYADYAALNSLGVLHISQSNGSANTFHLDAHSSTNSISSATQASTVSDTGSDNFFTGQYASIPTGSCGLQLMFGTNHLQTNCNLYVAGLIATSSISTISGTISNTVSGNTIDMETGNTLKTNASVLYLDPTPSNGAIDLMSGSAVVAQVANTGFWVLKYKTTLQGSTNDNTAAALNVTNASSTSLLYVRNDGNVGIGTTSPDMLLSVGSATPVGNVAHFENSTGSCYINPTTGVSCSSDARLKTNINTLTASSGIAALMQLNPVTYNWTAEASGAPTHSGFIAQQVQPILPDLVSQGPDGYYTLNYAGFTPYLVKAAQEFAAQVTTLANTIAAFADRFTTKELTFTRATGDELTATTLNSQHDNTQELCVGSTCVTEAQFKAMVAVANQSPTSSGNSSNGDGSTTTPDTTPPTITINGDNPAHIHVGDSYADLGATVTDNVDQNLGLKYFINGALVSNIVIDTSVAATDTIDYVATDNAGNTATSTRSVVIEAQAPSVPPASDAATSVATTTDATTTAQ